ncbi:uncharacterized protein [Pocillopora verrucosa]|uniref:uncharacterized protein n=1 Tax=Pocillopora verrucosa TaxID=203993 RepID=UPI00333F85D6
MDLVRYMYVLILLGVDLFLSRTDGERLCSCYTFDKRKWKWPNARDSCKSNNKTLAVMESEQEWQFITNEIQNKTGNQKNEWFIGLKKNLTTQRWTWINGKSVTIDKWYKGAKNPDPDDSYGMIHKEYPKGFKGSFSTLRGYLRRGWICEEETATCQGICFLHPVPTSTSPPRTSAGTKAVTTQGKTSSEHKSNALSALLTVQTSPTTTFLVMTKDDDLKKDTNCFPLYLANTILAALLFIVMIILAVVLILLRKKQHQIASRNKAVKTSQREFQESLALNTLNVDARPEFASRNGTGIERLHGEPLIQQEGVYTALSPESMMTSENDGSRMYTSLVKSTEDSDIEYVNQITAAEYVNAY